MAALNRLLGYVLLSAALSPYMVQPALKAPIRYKEKRVSIYLI